MQMMMDSIAQDRLSSVDWRRPRVFIIQVFRTRTVPVLPGSTIPVAYGLLMQFGFVELPSRDWIESVIPVLWLSRKLLQQESSGNLRYQAPRPIDFTNTKNNNEAKRSCIILHKPAQWMPTNLANSSSHAPPLPNDNSLIVY
jgi:hypothetical protein